MYKRAHLFFTSRPSHVFQMISHHVGVSQVNLQKLARSKAIGRIKTLKEANLEFLGSSSLINLYS